MGKAKRRGRPPGEADRLPNFIFGRDKAAEEAGGFILAGQLVTDFPKDKEPSESESAEIAEIIRGLTREVRRDPHLQEGVALESLQDCTLSGRWRGHRERANARGHVFEGACRASLA
jgi:hypothetical protein